MKTYSQLYKEILTEELAVNDVIAALNQKKVVQIDYSGDGQMPAGIRNIEPYLIGYTTANNLAIRAYQQQGVTATITPGWKIFLLRKIKNWNELEQTFEIRQDYNHYGDKKFKTISKKI